MTMSEHNTSADTSLGRDVLHAATYYLRSRWTIAALLGLGIVLGLYFGGWGWLVAAGLAPILLSTLPCLLMCGFGVCMMCKGSKTQNAAIAAEGAATTASTALGAAQGNPAGSGGASCCHGGAKAQSPEVKLVPNHEKENSHA